MSEDPPVTGARVKIKLGGTQVMVHPDNATVSAKWIGPRTDDGSQPIEWDPKYPINGSDMVVRGYLEEHYTSSGGVVAGDGLEKGDNPAPLSIPGETGYVIQGKGPNQSLTIVDTINWPYSVQLRDLTLEGGVIITVGDPYEDT